MHRQVHALRRLGTFEDAAGWVMLCSSIAGKELMYWYRDADVVT